MDNFSLDSIQSMLSGSGIDAISKRTKLSANDVSNVLSAGVPLLLMGMQRNSKTEEGAQSLSGALEEHSGADLTDLSSFLSSADIKDGKKILGHVFGGDKRSIVKSVSKAGGLSSGKIISILAMVAPFLLSLLGNQQSQQNQQGGGFDLLGMLGGLLGGGNQAQPAQESGLLGSLGGLGGLMNLFGSGGPPGGGGLLSSFLNLFRSK